LFHFLIPLLDHIPSLCCRKYFLPVTSSRLHNHTYPKQKNNDIPRSIALRAEDIKFIFRGLSLHLITFSKLRQDMTQVVEDYLKKKISEQMSEHDKEMVKVLLQNSASVDLIKKSFPTLSAEYIEKLERQLSVVGQ